MIKQITFKNGALPGSAPLSFEVKAITIFVGPNNSGKSAVLQEVESSFRAGYLPIDTKVLKSLEFKPFSEEQAEEILGKITVPKLPQEQHHPGHVYASIRGERFLVYPSTFVAGLTGLDKIDQNSQAAQQIGSSYLRFMAKRLDGPSRISLANDQPFGDLQAPASTAFQVIFRNDSLRGTIRDMIHGALGRFLVFDPTQAGQIRLRLAGRAPVDFEEEQSLTARSSAFHSSAELISSQSDGVKAFVGIIADVLAGSSESYLLDEPEAFLHPALAFTLGKNLSQSLMAAGKTMLVSTHSSQFLMGCVQSVAPVDVVRLTYLNGVATARKLPPSRLEDLNRNPFLRSANVLSGLFYESVIVCEADSDRAFYQEINEILLRYDPSRGIQNCLFLNANGKDTIPVIVSMLRSLGIPTAAIYDIDYVKDGGTKSTVRLNAAGVPVALHQSFSHARIAAKDALDATGQNYKVTGGIDLLDGDARQVVSAAFDSLSRFGVFIVPIGEVEAWLKDIGVSGLHGPAWLTAVFNAMNEGVHVTPGTGDVWDFIGGVKGWLADPNRQGIPEKME